MSECVGGGVIPGDGVSLNGEESRGIDDGNSSFDPSPGTDGDGDGDRRGLFDGGGEWDGLGVR